MHAPARENLVYLPHSFGAKELAHTMHLDDVNIIVNVAPMFYHIERKVKWDANTITHTKT